MSAFVRCASAVALGGTLAACVVLVAGLMPACSSAARPAAAARPPSARQATVQVTLPIVGLPVHTEGGVLAARRESRGTVALDVRLVGGPQDEARNRVGLASFDVRGVHGLERSWGDRTRLSCEVRASKALLAGVRRAPRARLVLEDATGRRMFLPNVPLSDWSRGSGGWIHLGGRPTTRIPIPLGLVDTGFDPNRVVAVGIGLDAQRPDGDIAHGTVEVRHLEVTFGPEVDPEVPAPDPAILASEPSRAARMDRRIAARLGLGAGDVAVGVNLPYAAVRAPDGRMMQLYARWLDAPAAWFGHHYDLNDPLVQASVRRDMAAIRGVFGEHALVRVMLFGDLRSGVDFDAHGMPLRVSARAASSIDALLSIAREEHVVLIPVLTDFLMADGRARQGPDGRWPVGEHPDLITDPHKRRAFFAVMQRLVRAHAGDPAVLAWEVMNEPENAVAVVTPQHFADLVRFLREGVEAIHGAGELATVGHRSPIGAARFMRGRIGDDLGQAHYYPRLEMERSPYDLGYPAKKAFGPLPAGWGEAPVRPGRVAEDIREARAGGERYVLYWSWHGGEPTGDGFAVQKYEAEIRRALRSRSHERRLREHGPR